MAAGLVAPAGAQGQAPTESRVLVLSVASRQQEDETLRASLVRALVELQLQALDLPDLPERDRQCREKDCLASLGRSLGTAQIIGAEISERRQRVTLWLYSAGGGTRKQPASFGTSWPDTLRAAVRALFGSAAPSVQSSAPQSASPTERASSTSSPPPTGHAQGPGRPPQAWRLGLGIGLATLGVAGLGVGIGASSKHGSEGPAQCPDGTRTACRYDMTPLFAPAYALAAVASVASILTFTLPTRRVVRKEAFR